MTEIANLEQTFYQKAKQHTVRQFNARVWRESRRDYFQAPAEVRQKIKSLWDQWAGQKTSTTFRYLVDRCTGAYAKRLAEIRDAEDVRAAKIHHGLSAYILSQAQVA